MAERRAAGAGNPLEPWMRRMLLLNGVLALIAGSDLYFASGVTERYFAWTIDPPLTAAFLGGAYLSSVVLLVLSGREPTWSAARVGAVSAQVFITLLLAAMLIHIDRFHTGTSEPITFFATWSFIGTYVVVPPLTLAALVQQFRRRGVDVPTTDRLAGWFRATLGVQGAALLAVGIGLVVAPTAVDGIWPWPLTPLTGRAVGAFLTAIGVGVALGVVDGYGHRLRAAFAAYAVLGVLELVALARYSGSVDGWALETSAYLAAVGAILASALYGLLAVRRRAEALPSGAHADSRA